MAQYLSTIDFFCFKKWPNICQLINHFINGIFIFIRTSKILRKITQSKVAALVQLQVLLLDEVSMLDHIFFTSICKVFSNIDHCRRPDATDTDHFGSVHVLLFGDLKQLPPATSQAPFIVLPLVQTFDFRVLRENRRVVKDLHR